MIFEGKMAKSPHKIDPHKNAQKGAILPFLDGSRRGLSVQKNFTKNLKKLRNIGKNVTFSKKIPPPKKKHKHSHILVILYCKKRSYDHVFFEGGIFGKNGPFFSIFLNFLRFFVKCFCSETTLRDLSKNDKIGTFWVLWTGSFLWELFIIFRKKVSFFSEGVHSSNFFLVSQTDSRVFRNTAARYTQNRRN